MGQDEVWWSSPAEVQRMALGIVSGASVRVYAAGAWWRPTSSGLDCGLRRISASGKLVKVHFSPPVADFV